MQRILIVVALAACSAAFAQVSAFQRAAEAEQAGRVKEALLLYAVAAREGDGKAAYRLGEIYEQGLGDVPPDRNMARRWFNAARNLGYPPMVGDFPDPKRSKEAGRLVP